MLQKNPKSPVLQTNLFAQESTLDFASRVSLALTKRTGLPSMVGAALAGSAADRAMDVFPIVNFVLRNLEPNVVKTA